MTDGPSPATAELHLTIVDDEELIRVALRRFCSALGMRVSTYASGCAFIRGLDESACAPDCLILDAHMPDMTGLEILQQLVRRAVRFPTIIYSADDEPEAIARYVEAGAVAYLRKPALADSIIDAITRALLCFERQREADPSSLRSSGLLGVRRDDDRGCESPHFNA